MKVFVSGCFDMLHSGHVAFLEEAASHGDLYVGIGSDQTVWELKGRRTVCPQEERLYMVQALRWVKEAWINQGKGHLDFLEEIRTLRPDILFVNGDGWTAEKEALCRELGIRLMVGKRRPHGALPVRSTTALRQECAIPYRVELGGGWLDQPDISRIVPGPVITASLVPTVEFQDRSGLATSSRKKAMELWRGVLPAGDRIALARTLFALENPPGCPHLSGSQDQLGLLLPGINRLFYQGGDPWPVEIQSITEEETLHFVEEHLHLLALPQRPLSYDPREGARLTPQGIQELSLASQEIWEGICARDLERWASATTRSFQAALSLFPQMATPEVRDAIQAFQGQALGWKLTGAGGGGYLLLISPEEIPQTQRVTLCRK